MNGEYDLTINPSVYQWTARILTFLRKVLKVNIKLHQDRGLLETGEIFVFNHFARFETFIPQYLIYQQTGAFCRSIADHELFINGDRFSNFLLSIGAIPNKYPKLLPLLSTEALRGRKIIVFPEGGMVKDRSTVDPSGEFSIYSRSACARRKHHTGAAVIAMSVEVFKSAVRRAAKENDSARLQRWTTSLQLPNTDALLEAAAKPTLIVPANITFYPLRVNGNPLQRGVELFNRNLSMRAREELLIEGNILLEHTDMDIRLGDPVNVADSWNWWERQFIDSLAARLQSLEQAFVATDIEGLNDRLYAYASRRTAARIRDACMRAMYTQVTVNLSHLASRTIMKLLDHYQIRVRHSRFHRILYLAVKHLQQDSSIFLHRSLLNPDAYEGLLDGKSQGFEQFIEANTALGLVQSDGQYYLFLPKLRKAHDFDEIRLENPVAVYANEVMPLTAVERAIDRAIDEVDRLHARTLARLQFDDECVALAWDSKSYSKPRYAEINRLETATASAKPFLFLPEHRRSLGIVLVHGFLASPAELRDFGGRLENEGYAVMGVRLKGHGTSPWDLRERPWQTWLTSVQRGCAILTPFVERICLVGFSTGAALALRLAAARDPEPAAVVAIATPLRFMDRKMRFVPLVQGVNRLMQSFTPSEGVLPFRPNISEHPDINYAHIPLRGLHELNLLVADMDKHLAEISCPVLLIQGTEDPIVAPISATLIHDRLGSTRKNVIMTPSRRHGILYDNIERTQEQIIAYLDTLERQAEGTPALSGSTAVPPACA